LAVYFLITRPVNPMNMPGPKEAVAIAALDDHGLISRPGPTSSRRGNWNHAGWTLTLGSWREMNGDDWQALRDINRCAWALLSHAGVLPEGLAAMLQSYASELAGVLPEGRAELGNESSERWERVGDPVARDALASRMGRSITDGEWPAGKRLDCPPGDWYCVNETRATILRALQLLAVRGELAVRFGTYYVEIP
jgi:hypothetical protein